MSLDLTCPHCQRLFRPSAEHAGKLAACPHCSKQVRIPAGDARVPTIEQGVDPRWKTPSTIWYVQAEDGKQYGPVSGEQLHGWYEEGRITADCQLLRKGAGQWQWATDLYPDLEHTGQSQPTRPAEAKPAQSRLMELRAAPTQSATLMTPLSPSDFPTVGAGLKPLGPVVRPLPPGYEEPRNHSAEALEDRRKFAPYMVARTERPPLHQRLFVVAVANFVVGTLRGGLYFVSSLNVLMLIGALEKNASQEVMAQLAVGLAISFLMFALNISMIAGGIGLLQQREWGRTATFAGTLIGMLVQLTGVCVVMVLGTEATGLSQFLWVLILILVGPSVLYDAFAAATLSIPSVVEDLED